MLPPLDDSAAADVARAAWAAQFGPGTEPTPTELLSVLAVARHETAFGRIGQFGRNDSHNWGAIVCARGHADPSHCFVGGMQGKGAVNWRLYPSDLEGARDMIRELHRRPAVRVAMVLGEPYALAEAMRQSSYFIADSSAPYGAALDRHMRELRASLGAVVGAAGSSPGPSSGGGNADAEGQAALIAGFLWLLRRLAK